MDNPVAVPYMEFYNQAPRKQITRAQKIGILVAVLVLIVIGVVIVLVVTLTSKKESKSDNGATMKKVVTALQVGLDAVRPTSAKLPPNMSATMVNGVGAKIVLSTTVVPNPKSDPEAQDILKVAFANPIEMQELDLTSYVHLSPEYVVVLGGIQAPAVGVTSFSTAAPVCAWAKQHLVIAAMRDQANKNTPMFIVLPKQSAKNSPQIAQVKVQFIIYNKSVLEGNQTPPVHWGFEVPVGSMAVLSPVNEPFAPGTHRLFLFDVDPHVPSVVTHT